MKDKSDKQIMDYWALCIFIELDICFFLQLTIYLNFLPRCTILKEFRENNKKCFPWPVFLDHVTGSTAIFFRVKREIPDRNANLYSTERLLVTCALEERWGGSGINIL